MNFEFATATRIIFGAGRLKEVGAVARPFGVRALVVTGARSGPFAPLQLSLEQHGVAATRFVVAAEPSLALVTQGLAQAREAGCEFVVALGGGSVIDAGKAIAALLANEGDLLDYVEVIGRAECCASHPARLLRFPLPLARGRKSRATRCWPRRNSA